MKSILGSGAPRLEDVAGRRKNAGLPARADEKTIQARPSVNRESRASVSLSPGVLVVRSPVALPRVHLAEAQAWFGSGFLVPLCHETGPQLAPNLIWRETHGGRKYPTYLPDYKGPLIISEARWRKARRPGGLLLSCISRTQRAGFRAPEGSIFVDVDIDQCFPSILAALSCDDGLAQACGNDLHQISGDLLVPHMAPETRRSVGKLFNLSAVGGITARGWALHLRERGVVVSLTEAGRMLDTWWASFPAARGLRDRWGEMHRAAAGCRSPLRVDLPGARSFKFAPGAVLGDSKGGYHVRDGTPESRLEAAVRTTLSSVFRGLEGLLLDRALQLLYPLREEGLRLVLPVYDGVLLQVPKDRAETLSVKARAAFSQALAEVGIPACVSSDIRSTWG
jgi:hypothetical protein